MAPSFFGGKRDKKSDADSNGDVIELGEISEDQLPLFNKENDEAETPSFLGGPEDSSEEVVPVFETDGPASPSFEAGNSAELTSTIEKTVELENRISQLDSSMALIKNNSNSYNEKISALEENLNKLSGIYERVISEMGTLNSPAPPVARSSFENPPDIQKPSAKVTEPSDEKEAVEVEDSGKKIPTEKIQVSAPETIPEQNPIQAPDNLSVKVPKEKISEEDISLGDAILTKLADSPINLFFLLKWLDFMLKRVGYFSMREALDFYVDVGWIAPKIKEHLVRHAKGIRDIRFEKEGEDEYMTLEDHLTSLVFISKLSSVELNPRVYSKIAGRLDELGLFDQ